MAADAEAECRLERREDREDADERERGRVRPAANHSTVAVTVNTAPITWAKRFAGPGEYRCSTARRGVTTLVASNPSGLSVGPVSARATKP